MAAASGAAIWFGLGLLSPQGLLLFLCCLAVGGVSLAALAPELLAVAGPALMPLPLVWIVFPYEMAFYPFAFFILLHMLWNRSAWLTRLNDFEVANGVFVAWAVATGLWCADVPSYLL